MDTNGPTVRWFSLRVLKRPLFGRVLINSNHNLVGGLEHGS